MYLVYDHSFSLRFFGITLKMNFYTLYQNGKIKRYIHFILHIIHSQVQNFLFLIFIFLYLLLLLAFIFPYILCRFDTYRFIFNIILLRRFYLYRKFSLLLYFFFLVLCYFFFNIQQN